MGSEAAEAHVFAWKSPNLAFQQRCGLHRLPLSLLLHSYGLDLFLLSIDEGIKGYRDDSLETVKRNEQQYQVGGPHSEIHGTMLVLLASPLGTDYASSHS